MVGTRLINPPFDTSAPCPACDPCIGMGYAYLFNALNRLGEPKMMEKLWSAKCEFPTVPDPVIDHPALHAYVAVYRKIMQAMEGVVQDGLNIRWVPGVTQYLMGIADEWKVAIAAIDELKDAHNADERHSAGGENILRPERGSRHTHWGLREDTDYNHFVDRAPLGSRRGDIRHIVCGERFVIADHFKNNIRRDPGFYGKFRCPGCSGTTVPWTQVEILFT